MSTSSETQEMIYDELAALTDLINGLADDDPDFEQKFAAYSRQARVWVEMETEEVDTQ